MVAAVNTAMNLRIQYNVAKLFAGQFFKKRFCTKGLVISGTVTCL